MASNVTIGNLTALSTVSDSTVFASEDSGLTRKVTATVLKNYMSSSTTILATGLITAAGGISSNTIQAATIGNTGTVFTGATITTTGVATFGGNTVAGAGTASTSNVTGALVVAGGVGVSGNIYVGGNTYMSSANVGATSFSPRLGWTDNYFYRHQVYNGLYYQGNFLAFSSTYVYIDTTSSLIMRGNIYNDYGNQQVLIGSASQLVVANTLPSTSTTTGALLVSGGVGISGAVNAATVNATTLSGTLSTAAQTNITSLGTLTSLSVGAVTSSGTVIASTVNAGTIGNSGAVLTGTLSTAAQTNITSVGTLTSLAVGAVTSSGTIIASTINAGTFGNASATHVGASATLTGTLIATTVNAGTIGNASATFSGASATLTGTLIATTVNAGTIGNASATLTGTLSTAAQTNITSVGTLTTVAVTGAATVGNVITTNGVFWANGVTYSSGTGGGGSTAASALTGTTLASGVTASSLTSVGTLTGLTVSGAIVPNANVSINLGGTTAWWNNIYGKAIQAQYADLAENYTAVEDYPAGTVVAWANVDYTDELIMAQESHTPMVAGVISTNPAYLMNSAVPGLPLALSGRVPCRVLGPVRKGDRLAVIAPGVAGRLDPAYYQPGCVIGYALASVPDGELTTIEVVIMKF